MTEKQAKLAKSLRASLLFVFYLITVAIGNTLVSRQRLARSDNPNPMDDDLVDG